MYRSSEKVLVFQPADIHVQIVKKYEKNQSTPLNIISGFEILNYRLHFLFLDTYLNSYV